MISSIHHCTSNLTITLRENITSSLPIKYDDSCIKEWATLLLIVKFIKEYESCLILCGRCLTEPLHHLWSMAEQYFIAGSDNIVDGIFSLFQRI